MNPVMVDRAARLSVWRFAWCAVIAFAVWLVGCGAQNANRTPYAIEAARCVRNEREIVDRTGFTGEQDREALTQERARCDAELARLKAEGRR